MEQQTLIEAINSGLGIELPAGTSFHEMRKKLQVEVNRLVETDFQRLVDILYRIDVNERKLKFLLQENVGEDTPVIIADLIIERQMEKLRTRTAFKTDQQDHSDEEKW